MSLEALLRRVQKALKTPVRPRPNSLDVCVYAKSGPELEENALAEGRRFFGGEGEVRITPGWRAVRSSAAGKEGLYVATVGVRHILP